METVTKSAAPPVSDITVNAFRCRRYTAFDTRVIGVTEGLGEGTGGEGRDPCTQRLDMRVEGRGRGEGGGLENTFNSCTGI